MMATALKLNKGLTKTSQTGQQERYERIFWSATSSKWEPGPRESREMKETTYRGEARPSWHRALTGQAVRFGLGRFPTICALKFTAERGCYNCLYCNISVEPRERWCEGKTRILRGG